MRGTESRRTSRSVPGTPKLVEQLDVWEQREPPREPNAETARARVLEALRSRVLVSTAHLIAVGGTEGPRRLRELRQMGFTITKKRDPDSNQYLYKLVE